MANRKLGIDVEINYPTAVQMGNELKKKWQEIKNRDDMQVKVMVTPDKNSLKSFRKGIEKYIESNPVKIKTQFDHVDAVKGIKLVEQEFLNLKKEMQKELSVSFDMNASKNFEAIFGNVKTKAQDVDKTIRNVGGTIEEMSKSQMDSGFGGFKTLINDAGDLIETNTKLEKSFQKVSEEYVNGELKSVSTSQDRLSALRQIVDVQKEINNLNTSKSGLTDPAQIEVYNSRIKDLEGYMKDLKGDFKDVFGTDPNSEWMVRNVESIGKVNVALREAQQEQDEVNEGYKNAVTLLNEQYDVQKRMETAGEGEKGALKDKLDFLEKQYEKNMQNNDLQEKMSGIQKANLEITREENRLNLEITNQKRDDIATAQRMKEEYRELKTDRKEIYNLEKKISDLRAKDNYTTEEGEKISLLTTKEKERLDSLELQLGVKERQYGQSVQEKEISYDIVKALEEQYSQMSKNNDEISEGNADLARTKGLYDDLESSIKEQHRLRTRMSTAGDEEKEVVRELLNLEQRKESQIEETIRAQNRLNDAREAELQEMKQVYAMQERLSDARATDIANNQPNSSGGSKGGILGRFYIDPIRLAQEAKQAFTTVRDSVAEIDSAMVDIAKVSEAPAEQLAKFSEQIYASASEVGLGTTQYLESVERWLTAGYTLEQSEHLGKLSSMGSFVGGVSESEMVDYMAVPLLAYKDAGLEAEDILNAMNEVANLTAVEMEHLGKAFKTSAGTASNAGTSFAELTGLITGAEEATRRGGDVIGRSLKAVDINFGKFFAQLSPSDETKFTFFESIGVSLGDSNGKLRSTFDILKDLEGIWGNLTAEDQTTALFYAGGKEHSATLQGIMQNWEGVEKATRLANEQLSLIDKESGSAFKEFEVQQDSVQFKMAELDNAWSEFLNTISGGKEGIMAVLEMLTKVVEIGTKIGKNDTAMMFIKTLGTTLVATSTMKFGLGAFEKLIGVSDKSTKSVGGLAKVFSLFGKKAKVADTVGDIAKVVDTATDVAQATTVMSSGLGTVTKVGGGLVGTLGKLASGFGLVGTAITVLDIGSRVLTDKGIFENVINGVKELTKTAEVGTETVDAFTKANKDYADTLSNNEVFNGSLKGAQDIIDKYKKINEEKKKAEEEGVLFAYSKDEFQTMQTDLAVLSEQLGVDLKITYNGEESIIDVINEAEASLNGRKQVSVNELVVGQNERNSKLANLDTTNIADSEIERLKKKHNDELIRLASSPEGSSTRYMTDVYARHAKELEVIEKDKLAYAEKTDEYKKVIEARKEAIKFQQESQKGWIDAVPQLNPADMSPEQAKETADSLMSTARYTQQIDDTYANIIKKIDEGGQLTQKEMEYVGQLNGEFIGVSANTATWADTLSEEAIAKLRESINTTQELQETNRVATDNMIKDLLVKSGMEEEEANKTLERARGSKEEFIKLMGELGTTGELALGASQSVLDRYGDNWINVMLGVQGAIDKVDDEVVTKYNLETEEGLVNFEVIDSVISTLPRDLVTHYNMLDDNGIPVIENVLTFLNTIPEDKMTEWNLKDETGNFDWDAFNTLINVPEEVVSEFSLRKADGSIDFDELGRLFEGLEQERMIELGIKDLDEDGKLTIQEFLTSLHELDEEAQIELMLESSWAEKSMETADARIMAMMTELDEFEITPEGDIDYEKMKEKYPLIAKMRDELGISIIPKIDADITGFNQKNAEVQAEINRKRQITVEFVASSSSNYRSMMDGAVSGNYKAMMSSVAIGQPQAGNPMLGRSFSQSIGDAIAQRATSFATGISKDNNYSNDRYEREPAKTDEAVWRYWAKELFKGLPLEKSMDELERSITKAKDNNEKLIPLYKQQIALTDKQIAFEKEMQRAQQSELNSVLSQLKKDGFKTSGNQITNLGIAKNWTGEKAERVNPLLTQYKSLYESINGLSNTISGLNQDKWSINQSIADAKEQIRLDKIAKELENIQKIIAKSEALITALGNDMGIFATKLGYIADSDFELKLSVSEEGVNKSVSSIKALVNEFNRLSTMGIADGDNAEVMLSNLESLKDSILNNADAVIEYRDAMKQLEIDRFTADFDSFTTAMDTNIGRLANNIESLREGLLSGQTLGELQSTSFVGFDPSRKTGIEKVYADRLNMEAELNQALDGYAKKNVDRTTKVSNAILQVESQKYAKLLQMQSAYSNGKVSTPTISNVSVGIGSTGATSTKDNKEYQAWVSELEKINRDYQTAYSAMVKRFDTAMKNAKNETDREVITNDMIISQLKLQESMYQDIIKVNNLAMDNARKMMEDTSLTTEQRQSLQSEVEKYEQANIDAQNAIKDSVVSRYELEISLLDKVTEKATSYSEELDNMVNIAESVGASDEVMGSLYDAVYKGKINQFAQATGILERLRKEQDKLVEGSLEWGMLNEKIKEVKGSLNDLTLEILDSNKDILGNQLDRIQKLSEQGALEGKTLTQYKKHQDTWMSGIEKELELESLRMRIASVEDKTLQGKLELMDRQESISKAELAYLDKQMSVIELQEKLANISGQRNVQTLGKDSEGNWQWEYVADQTEYESTQQELRKAQLELEKYRQEQRLAYAEEMNGVIDNVRNGEYKTEDELIKDIETINALFDDILPDISGMGLYDTSAIIDAYRQYVMNNQDIVSGQTGDMTDRYSSLITSVGSQFEKSFLKISGDLGKIIGEELRNALKAPQQTGKNSQSIAIQHQHLEFPNVTDSKGLEDVFKELPKIAKQMTASK